jgi:hypothetical protein
MSLDKVQSAIIPKLGKAYLCFLHWNLINEMYLLTKFPVDTSYGFLSNVPDKFQNVKINKEK